MADVNSTKPDLLLVEQGGVLLHAQHGWASDFVRDITVKDHLKSWPLIGRA